MIARELPGNVISRRAVVYVRQSTGMQVVENLESQRRQYELAGLARGYGFRDVLVIDDGPRCLRERRRGATRFPKSGRADLRGRRGRGVLPRGLSSRP